MHHLKKRKKRLKKPQLFQQLKKRLNLTLKNQKKKLKNKVLLMKMVM